MNRGEIVRLFKEAAKTYLKKLPKRYIGNQYPISEKALQREFAIALFNENIPFKSEKRYSDSSKRLDFKIFDEAETAIEIERYSALTDGFARHTFMDLHKMEGLLNKDEWGMFLAINVCNKYEKVSTEKKTNDPTGFAPRKTALHRKWKTSQHYDLIRMNPNYWFWPIKLRNKMGKVETFTVTILSCYGRYKGGSRWSRT